MSESQRILLIAVTSIVSLLLGGVFCITIIEHAAASASWIGVQNPVVAWTVVGGILGAYLGLLFGRFRTGRPPTIHWAGAGGVLLVALLALPALWYGTAHKSTTPSPAPPYMYKAWVTARSLNVRDAPSVRGGVQAALECGTEVRVLRRQSDPRSPHTWVEIETGGRPSSGPSGYVAVDYLRRVSSGRQPDCSGFGDGQDRRIPLTSTDEPSEDKADTSPDRTRRIPASTEDRQSSPTEPQSSETETRVAQGLNQDTPSSGSEAAVPPGRRNEVRRTPNSEAPPSSSEPSRPLASGEGSESTVSAPTNEEESVPSNVSASTPGVEQLSIYSNVGTTPQFQIEVYDGTIERTRSRTTVELEIKQTSIDFEGMWYPWGFLARNCVLTDNNGWTYTVVPSKSNGPEASEAAIGSSRRGRLVFRGPASTERAELFTLQFAYYMNKSITINIRPRP
jgi:hypothetical protein